MSTHKFIGEHETPALLANVRKRRPILGTGKIPDELKLISQNRIFYSQATSDKKPVVEIDSLHKEGQDLWRINIPIGGESNGVRPGLTMEKHPSTKYLSEIKKDISFKSHRPSWIDATMVPSIKMEKTVQSMRRFNGTRTEPLWVYDSARYPFHDSAWPWGLVGRIFNSDGYSGTGTLVGDRLVITAGHMVPWNSISKGSWWMRFVPAYFNGSSLYGGGVESYVSDVRGYNTGGTGYDWAILRLYQPLGSYLGYMGYNGYSNSWNNQPYWSNIGYPGDIANAEQPAFQQGFTINDTDGDSNGGEELETENCDLNHGNSGGPIFGWWNNVTDPRIVGVVSSQETENKSILDNVFASGSGFTNLCAWGRSNWPA